MKIEELIQDVKQSIHTEEIQKEASEIKDTKQNVDLSDLGLDIQSNLQPSEALQKIASELETVNTMDELVKVAEEAGNADLANLVKIAEVIGDKIADRVISKINA